MTAAASNAEAEAGTVPDVVAKPPLVGIIADDFTGATDIANTLVRQGMPTIQLIGVPMAGAEPDLGNARAVVIALKTRTAPVTEAVAQSRAVHAWLRSAGVRQMALKICSTFDSTLDGNIGPVADALLDAAPADAPPYALVCPAFPATGRTLYRGHLFVGDVLLAQSPMRDHPLTPMRQSNVVALMAAQSRGSVALVTEPTVREGAVAVATRIRDLGAGGARHIVIDAIDDDALETLAQAGAALGRPLLVGASGIAIGLPATFDTADAAVTAEAPPRPPAVGRRAVLAGSCSEATRAQLAHVAKRWPAFKLDPLAFETPQAGAAMAGAWLAQQDSEHPVVIYSSDAPGAVGAAQDHLGRAQAGDLIEQAFGHIARNLVGSDAFDVGQLIVAGGETSGAVVAALGVDALTIGPEIAPGVPWTTANVRVSATGTQAADREAATPRPIALALKSGNFGGQDFFTRAFDMLDDAGD